jgi:hypothetical protein
LQRADGRVDFRREKRSSPRGEWFSVFSSKKNSLRLVKIIKIILNKLIINNKIVSRHFSMEEKSGVML